MLKNQFTVKYIVTYKGINCILKFGQTSQWAIKSLLYKKLSWSLVDIVGVAPHAAPPPNRHIPDAQNGNLLIL